MSKKECIEGFSDYIFWDVDKGTVSLGAVPFLFP